MHSTQLMAFAFISIGTVSFGEIVNFDNFANQPPANSIAFLSTANSGSSDYSGVRWDSNVFVTGAGYVEAFANQGTNPYAIPHSGSYAIGNANGIEEIELTTTLVLTGAWFARVDLGNGAYGATSITVSAYVGGDLVGSASLPLTSTTPAFLDTSAFAALSGITSYRITRVAQPSGIGARVGAWVADDFQFVPPPFPMSSRTNSSSIPGLPFCVPRMIQMPHRRRFLI